jgi:hypothetical protein
MKALSPQQEAFCQAYLDSSNGTKAYLAAGYKVKNEIVAGVNAARLLGNASIQRRLQELRDETRKLRSLSRQEVIDFLCEAITTPIGEVDLTSRLTQSVEESPDKRKITMVNKLGAVKELCQIMGYYEPVKVDVNVEAKLIAMIADVTGAKQ